MADEKLDPKAPLTGKPLEIAKAEIKKAIELADSAIYKTVGDMPNWFDRQMQGMEDTLTLGTFRATRDRVLELYRTRTADWETFKKIAWEAASGFVDGKPMSQEQATAVVQYIQKIVLGVQRAIELVEEYAKGTVIWRAVRDVFLSVGEILAKAARTIGNIADGILTLTNQAVDTAVTWLPWVLGALVLGPFILRSFSAYKRGGAAAAADAAASELESGRRAVGEGARKAWEGGKSLATRAASGGVLSGSRSRKRSRRS